MTTSNNAIEAKDRLIILLIKISWQKNFEYYNFTK